MPHAEAEEKQPSFDADGPEAKHVRQHSEVPVVDSNHILNKTSSSAALSRKGTMMVGRVGSNVPEDEKLELDDFDSDKDKKSQGGDAVEEHADNDKAA